MKAVNITLQQTPDSQKAEPPLRILVKYRPALEKRQDDQQRHHREKAAARR